VQDMGIWLRIGIRIHCDFCLFSWPFFLLRLNAARERTGLFRLGFVGFGVRRADGAVEYEL
jgi:hypothetical protein